MAWRPGSRPTSWPPSPAGAADPGSEEDGQEQGHTGSPAQQHPPRGPRVGLGHGGHQHGPSLLPAGWGRGRQVQKSHAHVATGGQGASSPFPSDPKLSGAKGHLGDGLQSL